MTDSQKIVAYVEQHLDELLELLRKSVQLESPSHEDKAASDACGRFFQELFAAEGFSVEVLPQEKNGDHLIARMGNGEDGVLCVGHFDTVFPIGFLSENPFRIKDGKAYGPGILDMKGGIIMGLFAVRALRALDMLPQKRIGFFLNSDEESGSFHSSERIVEEARKYGRVIVLEPGYDGIGSMKRFRYGRATYEIIAHGRSAHSGTNPEFGINPLVEVSHQMLSLMQLTDLAQGVSVAPTCSSGGIPGTCVIPETASFCVDVRVREERRLWEIDGIIRKLRPKLPGIRLEILGGIDKPALPEYPELIREADRYAQELGFSLEPMDCKGGSDGNFTGGAGIPTIDGMGMTGLYLHTPHEYVNIDHIARRTAVVAQLIRNL